jgi:hypothetical protein
LNNPQLKEEKDMTKQWVRCLLAGAMLALSVGSAQAAVKFDNLGLPLSSQGSTVQYISFGGGEGGGSYVGMQFHTNVGNYTKSILTSINIPMITTAGNTTAAPLVSIYTSDAQGSLAGERGSYQGAPVSQLGTLTVNTSTTPLNGITEAVLTYNGSLTVLPDAWYWVILSSADAVNTFGWSFSDASGIPTVGSNSWYPQAWDGVANYGAAAYADGITGTDGFPAFQVGSDPTITIDGAGAAYMMQINADGTTETVPEPSTYALLVISLGVVGYARKRMNNKA